MEAIVRFCRATQTSQISMLRPLQRANYRADDINYIFFLPFFPYVQVIRGVGIQTRLTVNELLPYTTYMIRLQACLRNILNGCGTSTAVSRITDESVPASLAPPALQAVSPTAVQVSWQAPLSPNGEITTYRVYQRALGDPASEILVNQLDGEDLSFTHAGQDLQPYKQYEYQVRTLCENPCGAMNSLLLSTSSSINRCLF